MQLANFINSSNKNYEKLPTQFFDLQQLACFLNTVKRRFFKFLLINQYLKLLIFRGRNKIKSIQRNLERVGEPCGSDPRCKKPVRCRDGREQREAKAVIELKL